MSIEFKYSDVPTEVQGFLRNIAAINGKSVKTVDAYYLDLRTFFRYLKIQKLHLDIDDFEELDTSDINFDFINSIKKEDIYEYLYYLTDIRKNKPAARARKLTAVKQFFHYLSVDMEKLAQDPAKDINGPKLKRALPKYLSLDESLKLLRNIESDFTSRDYCIVTLFLNCGMRLSELVGINLTDYKENTVRILGKGNKERTVYLNDACISALDAYLAERNQLPRIVDKQSLFLSKRTGRRLSNRRVEQIVEDCLKTAGLNGNGYSPHKLRHTAATLMYQYGSADMLSLQKILGHAHVSTTEIYTHISDAQLKDAVNTSPLSKIKASNESE